MSDGNVKFAGKRVEWNLGFDEPRTYIYGLVRYGQLRDVAVAEIFSATTNSGDQTEINKSHVKYLKKVVENNEYSPTVFNLGTKSWHRDNMMVSGKDVCIEASHEHPLLILNGHHRFHALEQIRADGGSTEKLVDNLRIPYILYLNGNTRTDCVNLQIGKKLDKDYMFSIRIMNGMTDTNLAPYFKYAKDVAEGLHTELDSCFHNLIKFDTRGKLPLSLNSLCRKGASESAFSLYGSARIGIANNKSAEWMTNCILTAYRALKNTSDILDSEYVLSPMPTGTRAGSTFVIALGNLLATRTILKEIDEPTNEDISRLVDTAESTLMVKTKGNTSADAKRTLLGEFTQEFFLDMNGNRSEEDEEDLTLSVNFHEGIPVPIIKWLSSSTFNVSKLPTIAKKRGRKPKNVDVGEDVSPTVVPEDEDWVTEDKEAEENMVAAPWDDI